jgi:hypothetical protein
MLKLRINKSLKLKTMKKLNINVRFLITFALFILVLSTKAQTVPFNNNINCDVVVGYEARDNFCNVCYWGNFTIPANGNFPLTLGAACSGASNDACIWVISIGGVSVGSNHCYVNCCILTIVTSGADPSGCSSSGSYNVIYNYPTSWTINP